MVKDYGKTKIQSIPINPYFCRLKTVFLMKGRGDIAHGIHHHRIAYLQGTAFAVEPSGGIPLYGDGGFLCVSEILKDHFRSRPKSDPIQCRLSLEMF